MEYLRIYIFIVILVKCFFLFFALKCFYFKIMLLREPTNATYKEDFDKTQIYKHQTEFIFTIMMSFLVIYLYNPRYQNDKNMGKETKILIYIFGFIVILTSDWTQFIHETLIFNILNKHHENKQKANSNALNNGLKK